MLRLHRKGMLAYRRRQNALQLRKLDVLSVHTVHLALMRKSGAEERAGDWAALITSRG
jgi:hypothetical protein